MTSPKDAFLGSLVADAVAMPVHWIYDAEELKKQFGMVQDYRIPKDETYHAGLKAGENTLNFEMARLLAKQVGEKKSYAAAEWVPVYLEFLKPGNHRDPYIEGSHRHFLENALAGKDFLNCGTPDVDMGGLAPVAALFWALGPGHPRLRAIVQEHVSLTHKDEKVLEAADLLTRMLIALTQPRPDLRAVILGEGAAWVTAKDFERWEKEPDTMVVGKHISAACPISGSFPASLYLAWKYAGDFSAGICANAQVGGDSSNRSAVVGSLLGLANGVPAKWLPGLAAAPTL
jgi:ADP-ribosyl-[dinitrogen reductase] hydrolase